MRVLVCGGRDFKDFTMVCNTLNRVFREVDDIDVIIHGSASGADTLAAAWASEHQIKTLPFPADWQTLGRAAGPIRNQKMLDEGKPDLVVAFPGGTGTADMVRRAITAGVDIIEAQSSERS